MPKLTTSFDSLEVWFLTGSVGLYGQDTLATVARQSQDVVAALNASPGVPVSIVWKPVMLDPDSIRRVMVEANSATNVIGVITWMHTFSPAKMWIGGLSVLQKPLLHLATQANVELPWRTIDFDFMNLNQSAHGDREFAHGATRARGPRATVVGHSSDSAVTEQIGWWQRAAAGRAALTGMNVARFGDNMRHVAVTEGDKTEAEIVFGAHVNTWGVTDLSDAVHSAPAGIVDETLAQYDEAYDVVPELRPGGARRDDLRYAAAIEVGMRSFLEAGDFSAFTTTFEDLGALRQLPGLAPQRLQQEGYGFGPEGDWKSAILIRLANVMGVGLPGGASIMEDYTYDLTKGSELILGSHMLEVAPGLTATKPRLEIHPLGIGGREDPPRLVFSADSGPAVVVSLTDTRDRFRMVANTVEVVPPSGPLENLPIAHAVWRPQPDFRTSVGSWLMAGACHHTVMSNAVNIEVFRLFAEMTDVEFLAIDSETTTQGFRREIAWNDAYYRMTAGR